jgi:DNA gyrase subunit A
MGYIKRTNLNEYRTQRRGGKGSIGSTTRDEDFLEHLFVATTHNYLLFFTKNGRCFWMRAFEIPEGSKASKGRAIQNLINIPPDDKVVAYVNVKDLNDEEYINNNYIIMCTNKGTIKKTLLEAYSRPRQNGINAITVRDGETLLEARLTNGNCEILMGLRSGRAIRFPEVKVRAMGRNAAGVRGVTLANDADEVVGMVCAENSDTHILVVSEKGFGKRSDIEDYRITNRGGKGVKTINITEKTGALIALLGVLDEDDLMIITKSGVTIRTAVEQLRLMGRKTQGVKLINLKGNESIAAVARVDKDEEENDQSANNELTDPNPNDQIEPENE